VSNNKLLVVSIGRTAAGKTTILRYLFDSLENIKKVYISEGKIKRDLLTSQFTYINSMDESLRNRGYKKAIELAKTELLSNDIVFLDASFHQNQRRKWVTDMLKSLNIDVSLVWIYVFCSNYSIIKSRIEQRSNSLVKNHDNQADQIEVYDYINRTFDNPSFELLSNDYENSSLIVLDSGLNKFQSLVGISKNKTLEVLIKKLKKIYA